MTKISELSTLPVVDRSTDLLEIVDASDLTQSYKTTVNDMLGLVTAPVGTGDPQAIANKTISGSSIEVYDNSFTLQDNNDITKQARFEVSGITAGQTRTLTIPDRSDTIVTLGGAQTLTSKTLTSPTINTPTITNPTITVDTISEFTGANGVTIDGLNIKDGALNTANSVGASALDGIDKSLLTTDSNPYKFKAYMGSSQALSALTYTKLNMNTESFDTNSNYSTATMFYTIPVDGFYVFYASAQLLSQAAQPYIMALSLNGTTQWRRLQEIPNTTGNITLSGHIMEQMTAGQTVCALAYSGSALTINAGVDICYFGGYLMSRT